jgi:ribose transport system ATP-binding protein
MHSNVEPDRLNTGFSAPILSVHNISKGFPGVQALKDVSLDLRAGEIHAICGENGAGKSTLMKVLAGSLEPDAGDIVFRGEKVRFRTPLDARRKGILLIHQEISLVPQMTVAENLFLGMFPSRNGYTVDQKGLVSSADSVLKKAGYDLNANQIAGSLPIARQQMVELARASVFDAAVVIFDEPTASLTQLEASVLFRNILSLKKRGVGIVYISHKMDEIFELSDRITVLRDGEFRATLDTAETSEGEITKLMIGRTLDAVVRKCCSEPRAEILRVENLNVPGYAYDVSFSIKAGEIVGLYGLVGAGRSEVAEVVCGLRARSGGTLHWKGQAIEIASTRAAVSLGIALVPEDRKRQGLILGMSALHNLTLPLLKRLSIGGFVQRPREKMLFADFVRRLGIKVSAKNTRVGTLSGGNQQKIVIAKWLAMGPELLILDEPTRGVDVGAKAEIHQLISELAANGVAVLLISSEMTEIIQLSDRVLTMYRGRMTGDIPFDEISEERLVTGVMSAAAESLSPAAADPALTN